MNKSKLKFILILLITQLLVSTTCADEPYYGFYPSPKGLDYKLFRHNIFGFEIDIPANWTIGVTGDAPTQVIIIYPEGMNTAEITPEYETISIGILPISGITLQEASGVAILGMQQGHNGIKMRGKPSNRRINGNSAINFSYLWPSKTGNTVLENVTLVHYNKRIYSVTIRTVERISKPKFRSHLSMVNSFKPFQPVAF